MCVSCRRLIYPVLANSSSAFCSLSQTIVRNASIVILCLPAICRLADIFQNWVNNYLLGNPHPSDPKRTLVVTFISYGETILWFFSLAFILKDNFDIQCWQQALYYAIGTATIGSDIKPNSCIGFVIFSFQLLFAIFFITIILSRLIGYIGKDSKDD